LLISLLGQAGDPWRADLTGDRPNDLTGARMTLGALRGIKQSIAEGLLLRFEDLVFAEVFADLCQKSISGPVYAGFLLV
jgi:hypothetical protein